MRFSTPNLFRFVKSMKIDDSYLWGSWGVSGVQMIANDVHRIVMENKEALNSAIIGDRDFDYDYFGFKTLEKSYLLRVNGKVCERPQHMIMRVAVGIHKENLDAVLETYEHMSKGA